MELVRFGQYEFDEGRCNVQDTAEGVVCAAAGAGTRSVGKGIGIMGEAAAVVVVVLLLLVRRRQ